MSDNPETPADPFSQLTQGMAAVNEVFKSLMASGFTEKQALYIVSQLLLGSSKEQTNE